MTYDDFKAKQAVRVRRVRRAGSELGDVAMRCAKLLTPRARVALRSLGGG